MTNTILSTNDIGIGTQFTYAAAGDALLITQGTTIASTDTSVLGGLTLNNLRLTVQGTLITTNRLSFSGTDNHILIEAGGSYVSLDPSNGSAILNMAGPRSTLINDGSLSSTFGVGVVLGGFCNVVNTGTISGINGIFFGQASNDAAFTNAGMVIGTNVNDNLLGLDRNNGVLVQGLNSLVTNLASGSIISLGADSAGVTLSLIAGGSLIRNYGLIQSSQNNGVSFVELSAGQEASLHNWGIVDGADFSFEGSSNIDRVINRGTMNGNVSMGSGNDIFDNRSGTLNGDWFGGIGEDIYNGTGNTRVNGAVFGDAGNDSLTGGDYADDMFGGGDNDTLVGYNGDDTLRGEDGNDRLDGRSGDDLITGGAGNDILGGGFGDDALFGGLGIDTINGNDQNDRIQGDQGGDFMSGGGGVDTFVFTSIADSSPTVPADRDRISDFVAGVDIIELTLIDANTGLAGDQFFTFIGAAAFTNGTAGQVRYDISNGLVSGDVNGDAIADFSFVLQTRPAITAADFLL